MGTPARFARPFVAASAVLCALAASPVASAYDGVRMTINGRGSVLLNGDDIERDDFGNRSATIRYPDGHTARTEITGTPVVKVVELANIPRRFVRQLSVERVDSAGTVDLTGDEVRDGFHGDPLGDLPAVIYTGYGNGASFFRPLRDDEDVNLRDQFVTHGRADLSVALTTTNDAVRTVDASADDTTPDPGTATGFGARVTGAPGGTTFTYYWDFGDGTSATGAAPGHAFSAGHYRVTVTAVGDDGSSGVSDPIDVQVGAPAGEDPAPTATPPASNAGAAPGGGGPGAGGGAPSGGGAGTPTDAASGPAKSDDTTRGRQPSRSKPRIRTRPRATPTAAASATATPGTRATAAPTATPARTSTPTPTPTTQPREPGKDARAAIDGVLLAGNGSPTQLGRVIQSVTERPSLSRARRGGGGGGSLIGWLGGGSLLVVLLAGGAAAELRGLR